MRPSSSSSVIASARISGSERSRKVLGMDHRIIAFRCDGRLRVMPDSRRGMRTDPPGGADCKRNAPTAPGTRLAVDLQHQAEAAMSQWDEWWRRPWVRTTESVLVHIVALVVGFVMMIVGLALGVTMIMLPAGIVIGLLGVAIFVGGLFARINQKV